MWERIKRGETADLWRRRAPEGGRYEYAITYRYLGMATEPVMAQYADSRAAMAEWRRIAK